MNVLVLNSGSSSQKSCLYEIGDTAPDDPPDCVWEGKIEWAGDTAECSIKNLRGGSRKERTPVTSRGEAIERLLNTLWSGAKAEMLSIADLTLEVTIEGSKCSGPPWTTR